MAIGNYPRSDVGLDSLSGHVLFRHISRQVSIVAFIIDVNILACPANKNP
jgi:hypothetical protein